MVLKHCFYFAFNLFKKLCAEIKHGFSTVILTVLFVILAVRCNVFMEYYTVWGDVNLKAPKQLQQTTF